MKVPSSLKASIALLMVPAPEGCSSFVIRPTSLAKVKVSTTTKSSSLTAPRYSPTALRGIWDDIEYPDNTNRANRAQMLAGDINNSIFELQNDKREIDGLLKDANDAIANAYKGLAPDLIPQRAQVDIAKSSVGEWIDYSADTLVAVFAFKGAESALESMWKSYLLNEGRIGEAAFIDITGLPGWLKFGKGMGGAAAATAATFAIDAVISSITGAVQRDKLRDMINQCVKPRIEQQKNVLISRQVKNTLRSVAYSYNAVATIITDADQLNQIANNLIEKNQVDVNSVTDETAKDFLARLDKSRSAWTKEG